MGPTWVSDDVLKAIQRSTMLISRSHNESADGVESIVARYREVAAEVNVNDL